MGPCGSLEAYAQHKQTQGQRSGGDDSERQENQKTPCMKALSFERPKLTIDIALKRLMPSRPIEQISNAERHHSEPTMS
jgi:hypothetical protein